MRNAHFIICHDGENGYRLNMKVLRFLQVAASRLALLVFVGWLLDGCSSTPKGGLEQPRRLVHLRQAVGELGPPDKQAKLSDGKTVAEWITRRSAVQLERRHRLSRAETPGWVSVSPWVHALRPSAAIHL